MDIPETCIFTSSLRYIGATKYPMELLGQLKGYTWYK